jgi:hypothetical protein
MMGMMLAWFWYYLIGHTQRVRLEAILSDVIYCHFSVPQGSNLGPLFFIYNVDEVFRIFQHVSALGYAGNLKLFTTIESRNNCHRFQSDLDRL